MAQLEQEIAAKAFLSRALLYDSSEIESTLVHHVPRLQAARDIAGSGGWQDSGEANNDETAVFRLSFPARQTTTTSPVEEQYSTVVPILKPLPGLPPHASILALGDAFRAQSQSFGTIDTFGRQPERELDFGHIRTSACPSSSSFPLFGSIFSSPCHCSSGTT